MKILPVVDKLFHADGRNRRTDVHDEANTILLMLYKAMIDMFSEAKRRDKYLV
jgi:hypothetical protein